MYTRILLLSNRMVVFLSNQYLYRYLVDLLVTVTYKRSFCYILMPNRDYTPLEVITKRELADTDPLPIYVVMYTYVIELFFVLLYSYCAVAVIGNISNGR